MISEMRSGLTPEVNIMVVLGRNCCCWDTIFCSGWQPPVVDDGFREGKRRRQGRFASGASLFLPDDNIILDSAKTQYHTTAYGDNYYQTSENAFFKLQKNASVVSYRLFATYKIWWISAVTTMTAAATVAAAAALCVTYFCLKTY